MADSHEGGTVAIVGPGPQGLGCALIAAQRGAKVALIGLERDRERLRFARALGDFETFELGAQETPADACARVRAAIGAVDSVIETAGAQAAKTLALELVRPCGTIVQVSLPHPAAQTVNWLQALFKEVTIFNPVSHPHMVAKGLATGAALAAKGIDVGAMITHVYSLADAAKAIRAASLEGPDMPVKVALDPAL